MNPYPFHEMDICGTYPVYSEACVRLAHIKYVYRLYVYLTFYQLHR